MSRSYRRAAGTALVLSLVPVLSGCVGYSSVGAFTTTNIGVNVQATPNPVAEISFARREGALEPTFEDGTLPAVAASIEYQQAGLFGFASDNRSVFAGGNAAVLASGGHTDPSGLAAVGCLQSWTAGGPAPRNINTGANSAPTVFATDSTIGFKVTLPTGGGGGSFPNANLGYKRTEFAVAPIFGRSDACSAEALKVAAMSGLADALANEKAATADNNALLAAAWHKEFLRRQDAKEAISNSYGGVFSPSYLAVASNGANTGTTDASKNTGGFYARQVFATGKAAEAIAEHGIPGAIKRVATSSVPAVWPGEMLSITGSAGSKQSFTITYSISGSSPIAVTYAPNNNDTPSVAASALAKAISDDANMKAASVTALSAGSFVILQAPPGTASSWVVTSAAPGAMTIGGPIP